MKNILSTKLLNTTVDDEGNIIVDIQLSYKILKTEVKPDGSYKVNLAVIKNIDKVDITLTLNRPGDNKEPITISNEQEENC